MDDPQGVIGEPLLAVADAVVRGAPLPDVPDWDRDAWESLAVVALRSELDTLVGHWFSEKGVRPPRWLRHVFRASRLYHSQRNAALLREAALLQEALDDAGIAVAFRKGAHLCQVYPEAALRQFTDLDVLIRRSDAAAVTAVLGSLGYQQKSNVPGQELGRSARLFYSLATTAIPPFFRESEDALLPFLSVDCATTVHLPRSGWAFDVENALRMSVRSPAGLAVLDGVPLAVDLCANLFVTSTTVHYLAQQRHHRLTPYLDLHLVLLRSPGLLTALVEHALEASVVEPVAFALGNLARLFPTPELDRAWRTLAAAVTDDYLLDRFAGLEAPPGLVWDVDLRTRLFSPAEPEGMPPVAVAL